MRVGPTLKKILVWGGIAFLVFFVAFRPGDAAEVVKALAAMAVEVFRGIGDFFNALVS